MASRKAASIAVGIGSSLGSLDFSRAACSAAGLPAALGTAGLFYLFDWGLFQGFHAQLDLALLAVDSQHLDLDFIAFFYDIGRVLDVIVGHLADVHQPGTLSADIDKGAEFLQAGDFALDNQVCFQVAPIEIERLDHGQLDAVLLGDDPVDPDFNRLTGLDDILHPVHRLGLELGNVDDARRPQADIDHRAGQGGLDNRSGKFGLTLNLAK